MSKPHNRLSNCTEPDRAACLRLCQDFCNALSSLGLNGDTIFERIREDLNRGLKKEARSHLNFVDVMMKNRPTTEANDAQPGSLPRMVRPSVELYQSVWITFSDGTKAGYIGQAKALPGDTRTIENIEFTEPKPLPPNCHFGEMA